MVRWIRLLPVLLLTLFVGTLSALANPGKDAISEFLQALKAGDTVAVESMVAEGLSPNQLNEEKRPVLVETVKKGDFRMARLLLKLGANPNYRGKTNESPLFAVFVNRNIVRIPGDWEGMEKDLVAAGAKPDLGSAVVSGDLKALKKILARGESVNTKIDGDSLMVLAAVANQKPIIAELKKRKITIGLMEATALKDYSKVEQLIKQKADLKVTGSDGMTLMHLAAWVNDAHLIYRFHKTGMKADTEGKPNKRSKKSEGFTPLLAAGMYEKMEAVNALLDIGANVNTTKGTGLPPLVFGLIMGRLEFMKALLKHGANPNKTQDPNGLKPLHFASLLGNVKAAKLLLEHGATPDVLTVEGMTPLHLAVYGMGLPSLATGNLLKSMANGLPLKDRPDSLGLEAPFQHEAMIRLLVKHGADMSKENPQGLSPLGFAQKTGNLDLLDLLAELSDRKP